MISAHEYEIALFSFARAIIDTHPSLFRSPLITPIQHSKWPRHPPKLCQEGPQEGDDEPVQEAY